MEATIDKRVSTVLRMSSPNKMKVNNPNAKKNNQGGPKVIRLETDDYDYLINWKRERATLQNNRSIMFFFIGLTMALSAVIVAFEWKFTDDVIINELLIESADWEEIQDIPLTSQPPPPPPKQVIQHPIVVEVPDEEILEDIQVDMDVEVTEDMVVEEVEFTMEIEEEKAEEIFLLVEDKPEPVGGIKAFYKYVADHIKYPESARKNQIQGRVYVQFVVNSKGEITDVETVKGIGAGCNEEAARIVREAPNWHPGKQRGKPVSVRMVLPITFKLFNH